MLSSPELLHLFHLLIRRSENISISPLCSPTARLSRAMSILLDLLVNPGEAEVKVTY